MATDNEGAQRYVKKQSVYRITPSLRSAVHTVDSAFNPSRHHVADRNRRAVAVRALFAFLVLLVPTSCKRQSATSADSGGATFRVIGAQDDSTTRLKSPEVAALLKTPPFAINGPHPSCKGRGEGIQRLTPAQREELVDTLAKIFDPNRLGNPPIQADPDCALELASDIVPLEQALVGPLLTFMNNSGDYEGRGAPILLLRGRDAAPLLLRASKLPSNIVKEEVARISPQNADLFYKVLATVPVDNVELFRDSLQGARPIEEIALLYILAHASQPHEATASHIRGILRDELARMKDPERTLAALTAVANALPAEEANRWLGIASELSVDDAARLHGYVINIVRDKVSYGNFDFLVTNILENWNQLGLRSNNANIDLLLQLNQSLVSRLPLAAHNILVAPDEADYEPALRRAIESCARTVTGCNDESCLPDATPRFADQCDGRLSELSPRVRKLLEGLDTSNPALSSKAVEIFASDKVPLREFAILLFGRLADPKSKELLRTAEKDSSLWLRAIAFREQLRLVPKDEQLQLRIKKFLRRAKQAGCMQRPSFIRLVGGLGENGLTELMNEIRSDGLAADAAEALEAVPTLPQDAEARILSLLHSGVAKKCDSGRVPRALLGALMRIPSPSAASYDLLRRIFLGRELLCCNAEDRKIMVLGALSRAAGRQAEALQLMKELFPFTERMMYGSRGVNYCELERSSPGMRDAIEKEILSTVALDRAMVGRFESVNSQSHICYQPDGTKIDLRGPQPEEQWAYARYLSQGMESGYLGEHTDFSQGEVDRLIEGDTELLKKKLESDRVRLLSLRNGNCETILHAAVNRGLHAQVKVILSAHPEIDMPTRSGMTPLMLAVKRNDVTMTEMLLDAGASINLDNYGKNSRETALSLGVTDKAWDAVKVLLERGASPIAGRPAESTVVRAYLEGQRELVLELIRRGADPGFATSTYQSLIQFLTNVGDKKMLEQIRMIHPDPGC